MTTPRRVGGVPSGMVRGTLGTGPLARNGGPPLGRRTGVGGAAAGRRRPALGYPPLNTGALTAPGGLRAGGDMEHELVALAAGRAALDGRTGRAAAARRLALRAALLRAEAEEGEEPAALLLPPRPPLLCALTLVLPDRLRGLHLLDALPACTLVSDKCAPHLGHPAVDGGCLAAVGTLCAVTSDVFLRVPLDFDLGELHRMSGRTSIERGCVSRELG